MPTTTKATMWRKRKSNPARFFALGWCVIVAGLETGCMHGRSRLTPFRPPTELAHIKLEGRDSAALILDKVWLEQHDGGFFVKGYVMTKLGANDTMGSHVIISMRDANGTELRAIAADFRPRQIPIRSRMPHAVGTYSCQLDPLPPGTSVIVASASDDRPTSFPDKRP
jgi:hypothetical protein